ncbi:Coq4 family protein [Leptolyngbya sp. DQ-M1]|uniref:Coq4 family protein n=1 Tax=Leptolyngbya sp. DQ-M1 TaxID=2933920 RepID=UPI00329798EB
MHFKEMRRLNLNYLNTLRSVLNLLKSSSGTESVYDVEDALLRSHPQTMAASVKHMLNDPGVAALVSDRYSAPVPDIEKLMTYPPASLGYAFAQYISSSGFDPGFYRKIDVVDDATCLLFRLRQTHDIWHVVTGMSVDVPGEIGLKAFEIAQTRRPLAGVLVAGAFLNTLLNQPEQLGGLLDRIAAGYRMGAKAKPLLAQRWEEHWERPLAHWRSELGIEPLPVYIP